MSLITRGLIASTLLTFAIASTTFAQDDRGGGGFGGRFSGELLAGGFLFGDAKNPAYTRMVVLDNAEVLPEAVRGLVAAELVHRLKNAKGDSRMRDLQAISLGPPMGVPIQGFGDLKLGDNSVIQGLTVQFNIPNGDGDLSEVDEAQFAKLWEQSRTNLQMALRAAQQRIVRQKDEDFQKKRDDVAHRLVQTEAALSDALRRLAEVDADSSPRQLRDQLASTTATLRELELDRVSAEARREAISVRIDELRREAMKDSQDNPLIEELEKVAEIRERQLKVMREAVEGGVVSEGDLARPEVELATARVDVLKAKRDATAAAAGGVLHELNNEISHLIVRLAEIDARTHALQTTADELRAATSVEAVANRESLQRRVTSLQDLLEQVQAKFAELEAQGAGGSAEITITPLDEALSLGDVNESNANEGDDNAPQNE
jgi:hypothetical protein